MPSQRWIQLVLGLLLAMSAGRADDDVALVGLSDIWRYMGFSPEGTPPADWRSGAFDDSGWFSGPSGFGSSTYGESTPLPNTNGWERVLLRTRLVVPNAADVRWLSLRADYGGGFVAWLNGVEIARRGLPGLPDSVPRLSIDAAPRPEGSADLISIGVNNGLLRDGTNVLAVQLHSDNFYSRWPLLAAELLANFSRAPYLQNVGTNRAELLFATPIPLSARVEFGTNSTSERTVQSPSGTRHLVPLEGLVPGQRYTYRVVVGDGIGSAETRPQTFRALPMEGPLTVVVVGDSGGGDIWQHRVTRQMARDAADLMLHAGDIIYPAFTPGLADVRFLSVQRPVMRSTPSFFAWGNHDLLHGTAPFLDVLRSPTNDTPAGDHFAERTLPQSYYSFDAGDVHFAVLFQPFVTQYLLRPDGPQARWLERDLSATRKPWKVLISHLPWETSGLHRLDDFNLNGRRDSTEFADAVLPIARRHGVQLMLAGHDHNYERLIPADGITSIVTGGGGGPPYGLRQTDPRSSAFLVVYHYTRLRFDGDQLTTQCIDWQGRVQDESVIHRSPPAARVHAAAPGTPRFEAVPAESGQENVGGQAWDFAGAPEIPSFTGLQSNLGSLRVMLDATNLYLGLDRLAFSAGSDAYLLLEVPGLPGLATLDGLGDGVLDAFGQGADALDFAGSLSFTNFRPSIAAVVGEAGLNGVQRAFRRAGSSNGLGQGVFRLDASLGDVPGVWLRQFSRIPRDAALPAAGVTAGFVEMAIPLAGLGGLGYGQEIRVGAVVGLDWDGTPPSRRFDTGFIGDSGSPTAGGGMVLEGVRILLPADPDPDRDGLDAAAEAVAGTDPSRADTDGDGLPDGWEVRHRLDPLSDSGADGRDGDPDNDGYGNAEELQLGSSPTDPMRPMRLDAVTLPDGRLGLSWRAGRGRRYSVESAGALDDAFDVLEGFPRITDAGSDTVQIASPATARFYRLRVLD